jgi:DNA (cytosine-5)-methyltransferase 1
MTSNNQIDIFELVREPYHLPPVTRLFESFAGIGCQRMAFNRLDIAYESIGISEIDTAAIASYNAVHGPTKNYGSICDIHAADLPPIDVFTYSFPCTDLSRIGKRKGLNNTRSGLVYEVLRILHEADEIGNKPQVLIMENVVDLVQVNFIRQFNDIQKELEDLGYTNYVDIINARDHNVAQSRDRVFMVSILGDYYYRFPHPIPLEKKLKDYLETDVLAKYYISDRLLKGLLRANERDHTPTWLDGESISPTLDTKCGGGGHYSPYVVENEDMKRRLSVGDYRYDEGIRIRQDGLAPTLPESHLGTSSLSGQPFIFEETVVYDDYNNQVRTDQNTMGTITRNIGNSAARNGYKLIEKDLRVRKLTPRETWRLMGIDDADFDKAAKVSKDQALYKQAGNGIVVDVFAAILRTLI